MALNFSTSQALAQQVGVKVCVYSEAGRGKTRLIPTTPAPFILNADKGLLSIRQYNIPALTVSTLADLEDAVNWVCGSHEARQFATFCVDGVTTIADAVLSDMKGKARKDPRLAYGDMTDEILKHFRRLRDGLTANLYVTAEMEYRKDGTKGPASPGQKLGQKLDYLFDEVFYLSEYIDQQTHERATFLRTRSDLQCFAKDRSGALAECEPADLSYIFNKIASS